MSAFERKRLENIAANRAMLTDISAVAKNIIPEKPKKQPRSSKSSKSSKPSRRQPARQIPTRTSSRLAGKSAEDDSVKRSYEAEVEAEAQRAKAKRMRVSDDLNLGDIIVEGKKWGSGLDGIKGLVYGAEPGVRTFLEEDVKETTDAELKDMRLRMSGLHLYEHWTPNGEADYFDWSHGATRLMFRRYQDHPSACVRAWVPSNRGKANRIRR